MDPSVQAAVRKYMDRSDVLVVTKLQCNYSGQQVTVGNIHVTWGEMKVPDVQSLQVGSQQDTCHLGQGLYCLLRQNRSRDKEIYFFFDIVSCDPSIYNGP